MMLLRSGTGSHRQCADAALRVQHRELAAAGCAKDEQAAEKALARTGVDLIPFRRYYASPESLVPRTIRCGRSGCW
jgi:hypothetical protein